MSDKTELRAYPKNRLDALTMLYLQKQDFDSPEKLVDLYLDTYDRINNHFKEMRKTHSW